MRVFHRFGQGDDMVWPSVPLSGPSTCDCGFGVQAALTARDYKHTTQVLKRLSNQPDVGLRFSFFAQDFCLFGLQSLWIAELGRRC